MHFNDHEMGDLDRDGVNLISLTNGHFNKTQSQLREKGPICKEEAHHLSIVVSGRVQTKIAIFHNYGQQAAATDAVENEVLIQCEEDSELELFELFSDDFDAQNKLPQRLKLQLGPKSRVTVVSAITGNNKEGFKRSIVASAEESSNLHLVDLNLVKGKLDNNLQVKLGSESAVIKHAGLNFAHARSKYNIRSCIEHAVGNNQSQQLIKNIVHANATVQFDGKLIIDRDAQKSDASQYCHSLLLGDGAIADARPQLEVGADDVKAAHGATCGQIDEIELFYLLSRGITYEKASTMLLAGFQNDVLQGLDSQFLASVSHSILKRIHEVDLNA